MYANGPNIYQRARITAGLTQEQAAERIEASVESVKCYETGQRIPPDVRVAAMAAAYDTPALRLEHARAVDVLGVIPAQAEPRSFPLAVLAAVNRLRAWHDRRRARELMQIAEDGAVDDAERTAYGELLRELEEIAAAWLSLNFAEGIKKERPEAGTSKRSGSGTSRNPYASISLANTRRDVKPYFSAGEEVLL